MHRQVVLFLLCLSSLGLFFTRLGYAQSVQMNSHEESIAYPVVSTQSPKKLEQLKRGEYLTKIGDCIACHTAPQNGKPFAGGYAIKTPFGTIYSPNITPDPVTGIGKWSEQDFMRAMRHGISPTGEYYYPAFPFFYFSLLNDQDLKDIKAYLDAIPPVRQPNRPNTISFPFNWRFLQLGWRVLFFHPKGVFQPDPQKSLDWNRGNYLVNGLGHCAMCHTPSYYLLKKEYSLAAPIARYNFTGSMIDNFYAPDITNTLLQHTSVQEFADVFLKNRLIGGGMVKGPMKEANLNSLKYLTMEDIRAVAIYLKSVKNSPPKKPKTTATQGGAGQAIYEQYCAVCHTTGAGSAPKLSDSPAWAPRIKTGVPTLYHNAIHGLNGMPPKGMCLTCSDEDIQKAVNYIVSQTQTNTPGNTASVTTHLVLTMEDGKKIYNKYCAACHAPSSSYPNAPRFGDQKTWAPLISQGMDILIQHTIDGYKTMAPRGACPTCSDAEIKAAVKYLVQHSQTGKDFSLW